VRCGGFLLLMTLAAPAAASTWYFSPTGDDNAAGTRDAPLKSIANSTHSRSLPGDTLVLLDGVYPPIIVSCIDGVPAGNQAKPFWVKADHERRAQVLSDGTTPTLQVLGCAFWIFEGLDLRSTDAPNPGQTHSGALLSLTADVTLRKMVFSFSNRQVADDELLLLDKTARSVIEDSEFYAFHAVAARVSNGNGDVFRRDYFHSRSRSQSSAPPSVALAPCNGCLIENSISESNGALAWLPGGTSPATQHNRVMGSISLSEQAGVLATADNGAVNAPTDTAVSDFVVIAPSVAGIYSLGAEGMRFAQCSAIGGSDGFVDDVLPDGGGNAGQSFDGLDSLAVGAMYAGFSIKVGLDGGLAFTNSYDNAYNYIPMLGPDTGTLLSEDPKLGACTIFIPPASPMKGAGHDGGDIGANILYRTIDGGLTSVPLWDPQTGAFPCGAQVRGLNDVPDASCFDVHVRLDPDGGCPLPTLNVLSDGGAPDAGEPQVSAFGLRCASASGAGPWLWLAAGLLRRRRRLSPSS
jgi:hypothetical protein